MGMYTGVLDGYSGFYLSGFFGGVVMYKYEMKMNSLGVEPRNCECGGKFASGETMYAIKDCGWICRKCVYTKSERKKKEEREGEI